MRVVAFMRLPSLVDIDVAHALPVSSTARDV